LSSRSGIVAQNAEAVIAALPGLWADLARVVALVIDPGRAGRTPLGGTIELVIALTVCAALAPLVRRAARGLRDRLLAVTPIGLHALGLLMLLDLLGVAATAAAAWLFAEGWFSGQLAAQNDIAGELLAVVVFWRLLLVPVDLALRAREPAARLIAVRDDEAAAARLYLDVTILLSLLQIGGLSGLRRAGLSFEHSHALGVLAGAITAGLLAAGIHRAGPTIDRLLHPAIRASRHNVAGLLLARWYGLAQLYVLLLLLAWIAGALAGDLALFGALGRTAGVLAAALLASRCSHALERQIFGATSDTNAAAPLVRRCVDVGIWTIAAVAVVEVWLVGLFRFVQQSDWDAIGRAVLSAGVTLFLTYALWQYVIYKIDRHLGADSDGPILPEPGAVPKVATRLKTMLPLLRIFLLGSIAVLGALIVLTELGINTAPLIAGASVLGLAISFGSQALVRDVVSGIFFMADDAFRVGEYIDTGRLRGIVEGMSVRSLRLRHQNGQIHTIPFGQLASVTNFSRDWITTKFMVRFARDTDLEALRKAVKKIGQDSLADEEMSIEILAPLKLQGVAEIEQQALVCRFKFTTRPGKPTWVQRQYLKLMYEHLPAAGIRFADASVTVNAGPGVPGELAGQGAAAARLAPPPAAKPAADPPA
jgi:small-conductance mechanosensitive channel